MNVRSVAVALAAAGALLAGGAAPAFASGPPVPAGCNFDQATSVLTCTTTTTTQVGPITTTDQGLGTGLAGSTPVYWNSVSTTFDGFTGQQLCNLFVGSGSNPTVIMMLNVDLAVTTTTTTEGHGLNGKVFATSATTSLKVSSADAYGCGN
jgi:hypothetical protein